MAPADSTERYSGHESFICRYGWLPKIYAAISDDPHLLRDDERSTVQLGIGRNMVRSIQFWGDATGIIQYHSDEKAYHVGPTGRLLFGNQGWDPYLERLESLWLLHWILSTKANLAAWNLAFGSLAFTRFTKRQFQNALQERMSMTGRALAGSTVDQHVGIFCSSYKHQAMDNQTQADDTLWSPFQDLNLMQVIENGSGEEVFVLAPGNQIGLSLRVFATALSGYFSRQAQGRDTVRLGDLVHGEFSPGAVFRLNENAIRALLIACEDSGEGGFRLIDTADTQRVAMNKKAHQQWASESFPEGAAYV